MLNGEIKVSDYARLCKEIGLDGFDLGIILLRNHTPRYIQEFNQELADVGISLIMLTTYPDFSHPDPVQREREYDFLVHDIALASAVKAIFLRVTAGQAHPGSDPEKTIPWVVENLRKASRVADRYGVELVFENHSTSNAWYYLDISNSPPVFLKIVAQLQDTSISINFDTANVLVSGEGDTIKVLDQVIPKVKTIHVADISEKGKMDPVQLGTGVVPIKEIFSYLKGKHYDGWLCLEIWKNKGVDAVRESVQFVRETWEKA